MRQKGIKANNNTIAFLEKVPVYPERVLPRLLGMRSCNMPTDSFLVEDDDGYVFFLSEHDKQRSIELYLPK